MLPNLEVTTDEMSIVEFNSILAQEQIVNYSELKSVISSIVYPETASVVVNLFDCLSDTNYTNEVLALPSKINHE